MESLRHHNIVTCLGTTIDEKAGPARFYIVMERMYGSLDDFPNAFGPITQLAELASTIFQVLQGLVYIHDKGKCCI